ncbi:PREDICTED: uncharacterized protein LOC105558092 [Vollenhovia emeryi]|uniref:uncharacterized protein LOC105558092 n=1 Tax=Vollenhovia emeryi TaxID=411798 RepID=UPI0005F480D1|nr:PREDICTED: uncharacterized protein LOC105558092 [Vollenhovia emeryi]XP_011860996.1 PREDICTED: uncharacterized protein LOC105558092 [Vollenhovia emeryi]XP_011860997.1 PREDICTED: uncharacterized protein LOC105558092 [Vollenhovia emeryi]XP_011860998.1 PREDICTED: uncharacterized protein LOC105558092 [Vollenhovia emeryi]XP_011860999.1 PREDICTED: uncharacterized protein LOC105558092 [Vollenhovia emeryi]XP_011861000.1 PREDICTED: uncharacterized protein LOC105558092 [Vollenhovia emeryi]XP_01186100
MQSSLADQTIDCMGRCVDNLTMEERNLITDNIHKTLTHPKGNELFASYLAMFPDSLACLNMYNTCTKYLAEERNRPIDKNSSEESLESLITKVKMVRETAEDMNDLDFCLMKQFKVALETRSQETLFNVLEATKEQCQECLRKMHERFRDHILRCKSTAT